MQTDLTVEEANDLADDILLRDEFIPAREPGFFRRLTDRVFEVIGDFISDVFEAIFGGAGGAAGSFIAFLLLGVVLLILVFAIVRGIRSGAFSRKAKDDATGTRIVFDEVVDAAELRQELATQRAAGDWRNAVISAFRLSVLELIDQGIAVERPGATIGDFGRAVAANAPVLEDAYRDAARPFERAFYSDEPIAEADLDATMRLLDRLAPVGVA